MSTSYNPREHEWKGEEEREDESERKGLNSPV